MPFLFGQIFSSSAISEKLMFRFRISSDWKIFRKKISGWQERYMEKLTMEYIALLQNDNLFLIYIWNLNKE